MTEKPLLRFGVLGYPLGHSLSPALHEWLLARLGLAGRYERFAVAPDQLSGALQRLRDERVRGFNVTIPHKEAIVPFLDDLSSEARLVGAVNTVKVANGRLLGYNTDCVGFKQALQRRGVPVHGETAVILGAGGAARAVAVALVQAGVARLVVLNRNLERAQRLAEAVRQRMGFDAVNCGPLHQHAFAESFQVARLIVNATPVGMWPDLQASPAIIRGDGAEKVVCDLIYNPLETAFLKAARAAGAETVDGLDMFMFQGMASMGIWLQREQVKAWDVAELRKVLQEELCHYESD